MRISDWSSDRVLFRSVRCVQDLCDPPDLVYPLRNNVAVFIETSAEGVDQFGTLVDEPLSGAKQNRMALLLCRFRIDEAHFRPLSCNHDSLGLCRIGLLPLHQNSEERLVGK